MLITNNFHTTISNAMLTLIRYLTLWLYSLVPFSLIATIENLSQIELTQLLEKQTQLAKDWPNITSTEQLSRTETLIKDYEQWLVNNPDNFEGLLLYGKWLYSIGLNEKSFEIFQKINSKNPDIAVVHQQLANYYAEHAQPQAAYEHLTKALNLDPKQSIYWVQMGELLIHYKDILIHLNDFTPFTLDLALEDTFAQAVNLEPDNLYYRKRQAEAFFYQTHPNWPLAFEYWKALFQSAKNFEEREYSALQAAHTAYELNDASIYFYLNQVQSMTYAQAKYTLLIQKNQQLP